MGDNNEQEDADLAAMNDDDDDDDDKFFEVRYLGGRLDNDYNARNPRPHGVPDYIIPDGHFRLIIHASVSEIDRYACDNCRMLREVVFHNNVTIIGRGTFESCSDLQRIDELPAGLLRLEDYAFYGCASLQGEIVITASIQYMGDGVFSGCKSLESVVFATTTNVVELGSQFFWGCSDLRFVTLPPNLRSIPIGFFYDCTSLTHPQIPVSVTEIGYRALCDSGLRSVTIPENVHQIDREAFKNCAFLERVTIYSTDLNLADGIFANCPALSVIKIYPWMWPTVFASMQEHPDFIFKFFRNYQTKILDAETPDVSARLFRRLRRDRKRTATMMDDG